MLRSVIFAIGLLSLAAEGQSQTTTAQKVPMFSPDFPSAVVRPSPNFSARRGVQSPSILVLHYTATATAADALQILTSPKSEVSSHYLVYEDGTIYQLVQESKRAWHAGAGSWQNLTDINSHSIGIEIQNVGNLPPNNEPPFAGPQISSVIALCRSIIERYNILPAMVIGHQDLAPTRKPDPGHSFPWKQLYNAGIGVWTEPAPIVSGPTLSLGDEGQAVLDLQQILGDIGYGVTKNGTFDKLTNAVVVAFQKHWRQSKYDGIADSSTIETARNVLAAIKN